MSSVVISGDSSGTVTLTVPSAAGTNTITLPAATGTAVVAGQNSAITAGTAQASTSGTSIDFTSIPSWVKRVTVMFKDVSTSGTSPVVIQIGSGSVDATGYLSGSVGNTNINATVGFSVAAVNAASIIHGAVCLLSFGSNAWVSSGAVGYSDAAGGYAGGGSKTLSGTLDRVRITTINGTDTFDAGSINILYE